MSKITRIYAGRSGVQILAAAIELSSKTFRPAPAPTKTPNPAFSQAVK
jgi:hypothetical protein